MRPRKLWGQNFQEIIKSEYTFIQNSVLCTANLTFITLFGLGVVCFLFLFLFLAEVTLVYGYLLQKEQLGTYVPDRGDY